MKKIDTRFIPGDEALFGQDAEIRCKILRVTAHYPYRLLFEIRWWKDGERKEAWVDDFELEEIP